MRLSLLILLFLCACASQIAETPGQRYYALKADHIAIKNAALIYKQKCKQGLIPPSCHSRLAKFLTLNNRVDAEFSAADLLINNTALLLGSISDIRNDLTEMKRLLQ